MLTITPLIHRGVDVHGVKADGSLVTVDGALHEQEAECTCLLNSACACAPAHWIYKVFPRTAEGLVVGFTVRYASATGLDAADLLAIQTEILKWSTLPEWHEVALSVREEMRNVDSDTGTLLSRL